MALLFVEHKARAKNPITEELSPRLCQSHKFAEKGSYASEEENGEYMCQLSPNNPLWVTILSGGKPTLRMQEEERMLS